MCGNVSAFWRTAAAVPGPIGTLKLALATPPFSAVIKQGFYPDFIPRVELL